MARDSPVGGVDGADKTPDPIKNKKPEYSRRRRSEDNRRRRDNGGVTLPERDPTESERQQAIAHIDDNEVYQRLKYHYKKRNIKIAKNKDIPYPLLPNLASSKEDAMTKQERDVYRKEGSTWRLNQLADFDEEDYEKEIQAQRDHGTESEQVATRRIPKTKKGKIGYETSLEATNKVYLPIADRDITNTKLDKKLSDDENSVYVENGGRNIIWAQRGSTRLKDFVIDDVDILRGMGMTGYDKLFTSEMYRNVGSRKDEAEKLLAKIKDKYKNKKLHITGHSLGGALTKHILHKNPNDKTMFGYGYNSAHHRDFHKKQIVKEDERYKGYRTTRSDGSDPVSALGDSGYLSTKYVKGIGTDSLIHSIDNFPDKKHSEPTKKDVVKSIQKRLRSKKDEL